MSLEKKINTLIIEAGNFEFDPNLQNTFDATNSGDFNFDLTINRIKQFGGTSNVWGKRCKPLDNIDYSSWSKKEINLDNYLIDSSKMLNVNNDFNEQPLNENLKQVKFNYSKIDFANFYKKKISESKFIDVVLNSTCLKLNGNYGNFNTAEIIDNNNNKKYFINAKYFIYGCGGIENSRFLLLLQKKYNALNPNLPIGNYWMGHFKRHFGELLADFNKLNSVLNRNDYLKNSDTAAIALSSKFIEKNQIENACVYLQPNQISKNKINEITKKFLCIAPEYSKHLVELFKKNLLCGTSLEIIWGQKSVKSNCIKLSHKKKDYLNIPQVEVYCNSIVEDLSTPKIFMKELGKYFVNSNIGRLHYFNINNKKNIQWEGNHHIGGTIIGDNPKSSVVNSDLKVHYTKNLFVIGSSIFSRSGHANPTFSIVQFSNRLGEYFSKILS